MLPYLQRETFPLDRDVDFERTGYIEVTTCGREFGTRLGSLNDDERWLCDGGLRLEQTPSTRG